MSIEVPALAPGIYKASSLDPFPVERAWEAEDDSRFGFIRLPKYPFKRQYLRPINEHVSDDAQNLYHMFSHHYGLDPSHQEQFSELSTAVFHLGLTITEQNSPQLQTGLQGIREQIHGMREKANKERLRRVGAYINDAGNLWISATPDDTRHDFGAVETKTLPMAKLIGVAPIRLPGRGEIIFARPVVEGKRGKQGILPFPDQVIGDYVFSPQI